MCGIAGLYRAPEGPLHARDRTAAMLARIEHRGPDGLGLYFDEMVAFGTARLAIIDVAGGDQPIGDPTGRFWIAFNGEIYNYRELREELASAGFAFRTSSDTEVFLAAWITWGEAALSRLNGAFGAAIYDRDRSTLALCRDRFGKRPLFYTRLAGGFAFASEVKSFLELGTSALALDGDRLATIYAAWTPVDGETCFSGIDQVPAGSILLLTPGGAEVRTYAPLYLDVAQPSASAEEAIEVTRDLLTRSVRLRMRSDVGAGTYLSGGLDSSIVTSLAADCGPALKTYSIAFADESYDESGEQALVADRLGTEHHRLQLTDEDIAAALPDALWHAETPVFRSAFVPMYLLSRFARSHGTKVVLTGEGADEAFLGYDIFRETMLRSAWNTLDEGARRDRLAGLYPYLDQFGPDNQRALYAYFDRTGGSSYDHLFSHDLRFRSTHHSVRLLKARGDGLGALRRQIGDEGNSFAGLPPVAKAQWIEFKTLLAGYLLSTQGDRMALAHGVENRCPFLDPDVVQWGFATRHLYDDGWSEKALLKRAFARRLPSPVINRPKQPYLAPDVAALASARPDYLELFLSDREMRKVGLLDHAFCRRLVNKVLSNPAGASQAERQAFMFLLSTVMIHHQFIAEPRRLARAPRLSRQIDGRDGRIRNAA